MTNHPQIDVQFEDIRYPIVIVEDDNGVSHGYMVSLRTGQLVKVCLCMAHYPSECMCGYDWKVEE